MDGGSSFPKGLRVLLLDEPSSRGIVEVQLQCPDLGYQVTSCSSAEDALSSSRAGVAAFDVVLAEAKLAAPDEAAGRAFVESFEDTPVLLMSETGGTADVLRAVKMGAVDFLDKPLSLLKLKNIWQHSVRKMMQRASGAEPSRASGGEARPAFSGGATLHSSPESPGTPSAESVPRDASYSSLGSVRQPMDTEPSCYSLPRSRSFDGCDFVPGAGAPTPRGPPAGLGPLVAVPPPTHWPALPTGQVWGAPAGGPVMPPLPGSSGLILPQPAPAPAAAAAKAEARPPAPPAPALSLKSCHTGVLPQPASTNDLQLPDGFLSAEICSSTSGPLGLKLKKSDSLLNLINATLTCAAPSVGAGCFC